MPQTPDGGGPPVMPRPLAIPFSGEYWMFRWPYARPQTPDGGGPPVMPRPLAIPFSGEYWMFRWPYARPPKTSFFQRGSPAVLSFTSTDHRPLQMEARHKLDQSIALSCCSAIRLEIRNADRYPNTIS